MQVHLEEIGASDVERLAAWFPQHDWPYHLVSRVDANWVRERADRGFFFGGDTKSFWTLADNSQPVGVVRVFDLSDVTPLLDLRIGSDVRGKGVGSAALGCISRFVFETYAETVRLGGYTRHDNASMRRVFEKCGFVQEAYHRQSWRVDAGPLADAVGYAILRSDWLSGTTTPIVWR